MLALLASVELGHRHEIQKLAGIILAYRQQAVELGLPELDEDVAGGLALNQFHRLRNALEACYLHFDGNPPAELLPFFRGTILT